MVAVHSNAGCCDKRGESWAFVEIFPFHNNLQNQSLVKSAGFPLEGNRLNH